MAEDNKDFRQPPKPPPLPASFFRPLPPDPEKIDAEKRIADLEKRLAEEHEKLLVANLKSQQEAANAARVEVSIRELQDKLRRDRRESEAEEARRALTAKVQELEARLVYERESWAAALKSQMQGREAEEHKDKDEEMRQLQALGEKLRDAETKLVQALAEKKFLEERLNESLRERAQAEAQVQAGARKESEAAELKGELAMARRQCAMLEARLERELGELRGLLRQREESLSSLSGRLAAEHEAELRQIRAEAAAEILKHKEGAESAAAERGRLKAVTGALERQLAASRVQIEELKRACAQGEQSQARAKAEFSAMERRWMEQEKEIRSAVIAQAQEKFQAQLTRLQAVAQEEINRRLARVAQEREELQRLSTAQAAQIKALEEKLHRQGSAASG